MAPAQPSDGIAAGPPPQDWVQAQRRLAADDAAAFAAMVETNAGPVLAMLRRRFGAALDAASLEDALGDAAMKAWRSRHCYDATLGSPRAWFGAIAIRCALDLVAGRQRLGQVLPDLDQRPAREATGSSAPRSSDLLLDLHRCIAELPRLQRVVLLADLAADGRAPAGELAAVANSSLGSIYVARAKATRTIRERLRRMGHRIADDGDPTRRWQRRIPGRAANGEDPLPGHETWHLHGRPGNAARQVPTKKEPKP